MDLETIAKLTPREYHARRDAERHAAREALRRRQLTEARAAIRRLAPEFPAIRAVYLFGSVLQPGWFTEASDLDVAVEVDDLEAEGPFVRALERELERLVDLRSFEGAIQEAVESDGEQVYDREVPDSRP
jgi:predicted nucleotidyltransferase